MTDPEANAAMAYAAQNFGDEAVMEDFARLARYRPDVFAGYVSLRQAAFNTDESAALDVKTKELIIIAMEVMARKTNPPPTGHTRKAMEAGATVEEIAEVVSLAIMIGGMLTHQEAGRFVLRAAEEFSTEHERAASTI